MADNNFLPKLSQKLLDILKDDEYYDIKVEVGKHPYVEVFCAHIIILYYHSPYFRRILFSKRNDGTLIHIKLPDISPEIFQIILKYIYGGGLSLESCDAFCIIKILEAADELGLQELVTYLQTYFVESRANWIEQNLNLIYHTSFEHDSFLELQQFCTELMSKKPEKLLKSLDFASMSEKSLASLIQNDNLQMNEVQAWELVLRWGLAQNPDLSLDPSSYSKDDFDALKSTLQQCIPLIRFYNFTSKEFLEKVFQYKKILPEELSDDLLKYFLDPSIKSNNISESLEVKEDNLASNKPNNTLELHGAKKINVTSIDSNIISNKHAELISKWIDKIDTSEHSFTSYEFKLMLRGTRDGFIPKKFHEICDNQSRTVLFIKVKNSNEILGGYNPIEWKSCKSVLDKDLFGITKDSFIFSFKDKENVHDCILSRVKNEKFATNNTPYLGPSFGVGDLTFHFTCDYNYCKNCDYEIQIRETNDYFSMDEYEVFQVIRA